MVSSTTVAPVSLNPGAARFRNTIDYSLGTTTNPTMDFGFSYLYALGNRLWFENTVNEHTIIDGTEVGVMDDVTVDSGRQTPRVTQLEQPPGCRYNRYIGRQQRLLPL